VSSADPKRSEGSGRELGAHERSCPDWKHRPMVGASGPDLNEVRVQHCRSSRVLTASPTEVRAQIGRELEVFGHGQECQARTRHEVRVQREAGSRFFNPKRVLSFEFEF
jgi:hypothetical protein